MSSKSHFQAPSLPALAFRGLAAAGGLALALALAGPAVLQAQDAAAKAMAAEHAHDQPKATAAATTPPSRPVTGESVVYGESAGQKLNGYLAKPKAASGKPPNGEGKPPGLIVIHEWWGLNDNIRDMAKRLAGEGYQALAVDLYGGKVAQDPDTAMHLMEASNKEMTAGQANIQAAYAYLKQQGAPRVGVIGWCFGGGWSLSSAILLGDKLDATVIYYGRLVDDPQKLGAIQSPVIGFFGGKDNSIPPEMRKKFEDTMKSLKKPVEMHVYPEANHAFANPSGGNYNPEAAKDAWKRTVDFLAANLKKR